MDAEVTEKRCIFCKKLVTLYCRLKKSEEQHLVQEFFNFVRLLSVVGNEIFGFPPGEVCELCTVEVKEAKGETVKIQEVQDRVGILQMELLAELRRLDCLLERFKDNVKKIGQARKDSGLESTDHCQAIPKGAMKMVIKARKTPIKSKVKGQACDTVGNAQVEQFSRPPSVASCSNSFNMDVDMDGSELPVVHDMERETLNETVKIEPIFENVNDDSTHDTRDDDDDTQSPRQYMKHSEPSRLNSSKDGVDSNADSSRPPKSKNSLNRKEAYHCEKCNMSFATRRNYDRHLTRTIHLNGILPEFPCHQCHKVFSSKWRLKSHSDRVHDRKHASKCDHCQKSCPSRAALQVHLVKYHKLEAERAVIIHKCDICDDLFESKGARDKHIDARHKSNEERSFKTCNLCGRTMLQAGFKRHHLFCSAVAQDKSRQVVCDICGKASKNELAFKHHLRRHKKADGILKCASCGKTGFKSELTLKEHEKLHGERETHVCQKCGGVFHKSAHLKRHINGCNGTGRRKQHSNLIKG